jgi:hypothetical protein
MVKGCCNAGTCTGVSHWLSATSCHLPRHLRICFAGQSKIGELVVLYAAPHSFHQSRGGFFLCSGSRGWCRLQTDDIKQGGRFCAIDSIDLILNCSSDRLPVLGFAGTDSFDHGFSFLFEFTGAAVFVVSDKHCFCDHLPLILSPSLKGPRAKTCCDIKNL